MTKRRSVDRAHTYLPDTAEGALVAEFIRVLDEAGVSASGPRPALVSSNGESFELPPSMYDALRHVAHALAEGKGVSVAPLSAKLTTQQAADYLGMSRPTVVRLLEDGEIPMEKPGRHRYVRLLDLVEYQDRIRVSRRSALERMVEEAVADDLYEKTDRSAPATR